MFENLRTWLNSSRDYYTGVVLFEQSGGDKNLLAVLSKGPNEFRIKRLGEELISIFEKMKADSPAQPVTKSKSPDPEQPPVNENLYQACKKEADHVYKKTMNDRAILFSLANVEDFTDPNIPAKIQAREKLAIDVVIGFQKASELYDRAAYVKSTGRLPNTEEKVTSEYDHLPDHLVKQQLDNARKAFNKLKAKEPTPTRIELMQKHQINIQKLEKKWRSLQH